jgi:PIN domain nuclease of toxin-antitoxin system
VTEYVIDTSAFLAIFRDEAGADKASARLPKSVMSAVNVSEGLMRGAEKGVPVRLMRDLIAAQQVRIVPFDESLAVEAALLRPTTKHLGLSFADRACIATAAKSDATVVTADRAWANLDLPCPVELIR